MLRVGLDRFVADVAFPCDLGRTGIPGELRRRRLLSRGYLCPIAKRRQRHRELPADFSERNVRDSVALGDRRNRLRPNFLVKLGALIAKGDVWHPLPSLSNLLS